MKKMIVCGVAMLGALAIGGQMMAAQACEGTCKPKTEKPAPAPTNPA